MAAIINALDNNTNKQIGKNGHIEYSWSDNIREKILQFSFQLVRTNEKNEKKMSNILKDMLTTLKQNTNSTYIAEKEIAKGYLSILYRMIGHTRDIINGKGEYTLTYMLIYTWFQVYPNLALFALKCLVINDEKVVKSGLIILIFPDCVSMDILSISCSIRIVTDSSSKTDIKSSLT